MAEFNPVKYETPFFLLDEAVLLRDVAAIEVALRQYWANFRIGYSVKTNSLPGLASILKKQNIWAEVVSEDEYNMVSAMGYTPDKIICNGPVKREAWVKMLLDKQVMLHVDSHRELDYIFNHASLFPERLFTVGLRVNMDTEQLFPGESKGEKEGSRFGFSRESGELSNAIKQLRSCPNVAITGLHLHTSTTSRRCEIYRWLVREFASIVADYALSDIRYLDIGGGFYGGLPGKPSWTEYLEGIAEELLLQGFTPQKLTLVLEPGVSLLAGCFCYYTRITDSKDTVRQTYAVCDGSRIHVDPLMHKSSYFYQIIRNTQLSETRKPVQQLVGFTCLENDRFFKLFHEPVLSEGDMVRFDKVGAYTLSLSPLFISYFPAVYVKRCDGNVACIRKKWGTNEFLQLSGEE